MNMENETRAAAPSLAAIREGNGSLKVGDTGSSVTTCRTLLNNKGYSCSTSSSTYDAALKAVVKRFQTAYGLTSDGILGQGTLAVLEDTQSDVGWFVNGKAQITAGKLARLGFKKLVLKPANVKKLNDTCNSFGIDSKTKVRHFLAQGMIETMYGQTFMENSYTPGNPSADKKYSPYYGAGFLQLTWNYNYTAFRDYMKKKTGKDDPKITTPSNYATQYVATNYPYESAGWFWHVNADLNNKLVEWAPLSAEETVKKVTKTIKGDDSSYKDRLAYYEKAKAILK